MPDHDTISALAVRHDCTREVAYECEIIAPRVHVRQTVQARNPCSQQLHPSPHHRKLPQLYPLLGRARTMLCETGIGMYIVSHTSLQTAKSCSNGKR